MHLCQFTLNVLKYIIIIVHLIFANSKAVFSYADEKEGLYLKFQGMRLQYW